jgi:hypothetical protein
MTGFHWGPAAHGAPWPACVLFQSEDGTIYAAADTALVARLVDGAEGDARERVLVQVADADLIVADADDDREASLSLHSPSRSGTGREAAARKRISIVAGPKTGHFLQT